MVAKEKTIGQQIDLDNSSAGDELRQKWTEALGKRWSDDPDRDRKVAAAMAMLEKMALEQAPRTNYARKIGAKAVEMVQKIGGHVRETVRRGAEKLHARRPLYVNRLGKVATASVLVAAIVAPVGSSALEIFSQDVGTTISANERDDAHPQGGITASLPVAVESAIDQDAVLKSGEKLTMNQVVERFGPLVHDVVSKSDKLAPPEDAILAQLAHESGTGRDQGASRLALEGNNFFGIKADQGWIESGGSIITLPTTEVVDGKTIQIDAAFRAYESPREGIEGYIEKINQGAYQGNGTYDQRYLPALQAYADTNDPRVYAQGLANAGYATDPQYADKFVSSINEVESVRVSIAKAETTKTDVSAVRETPKENYETPTLQKIVEISKMKQSKDGKVRAQATALENQYGVEAAKSMNLSLEAYRASTAKIDQSPMELRGNYPIFNADQNNLTQQGVHRIVLHYTALGLYDDGSPKRYTGIDERNPNVGAINDSDYFMKSMNNANQGSVQFWQDHDGVVHQLTPAGENMYHVKSELGRDSVGMEVDAINQADVTAEQLENAAYWVLNMAEQTGLIDKPMNEVVFGHGDLNEARGVQGGHSDFSRPTMNAIREKLAPLWTELQQQRKEAAEKAAAESTEKTTGKESAIPETPFAAPTPEPSALGSMTEGLAAAKQEADERIAAEKAEAERIAAEQKAAAEKAAKEKADADRRAAINAEAQNMRNQVASGEIYKSSANIPIPEDLKNVLIDHGVQDGYREGRKIPVHIVSFKDYPNLKVNVRIARVVHLMLQDMESRGFKPSWNSSFRTFDEQRAEYEKDNNNAVPAGWSNHQLGLAIDWQTKNNDGSDTPVYKYMTNKSSNPAFLVNQGERWHWSPTGN